MAAVTYAFSRFKINGSMSACMRTFGEKLLYPLSNSIVIQDVTRRKKPTVCLEIATTPFPTRSGRGFRQTVLDPQTNHPSGPQKSDLLLRHHGPWYRSEVEVR